MTTRFEILATPISDLRILQRKPLGDDRGYLERLFCTEELHAVLSGKTIAQINHTLTASRGTVRGMHFQHPPHAETKFVSCLRGEVFDVAVDLRQSSPTFGQWVGAMLNAANHQQLWVPVGFAHGFLTLSASAEVLYKASGYWSKSCERSLRWSDPDLAIAWPLGGMEPLLAQKDADAPELAAVMAAGEVFA